MALCKNCSQTVGGQPTIKCDGCRGVVHVSCTGLDGDTALRLTRSACKNFKIFCNSCNSTDDKFEQLKQFLSNLIDERIAALESKFCKVTQTTSTEYFEEVVSEAMDRIHRSKNLILRNVPETGQAQDDESLACNVIRAVQGDRFVQPIAVSRLGKPVQGRQRLLKLSLSTESQAREILRNKRKLGETPYSRIFLHGDSTPKQQAYFKQLRAELQQRKDSGESHISIKYINGVPRIINTTAKN